MTNPVSKMMSASTQETLQAPKTASRLEQKAGQLAKSHTLGSTPFSERSFIGRLDWQKQQLKAAHRYFQQSAATELTLSYAAEWLLDNFYVVQQVVRQIDEDLPPGFYRRLPKLAAGPEPAGLPRIYALAKELVLIEQAQLDRERIQQFVQAYQALTPLTMGEIWALPIMLRFVLLESLAQAVNRLTGVGDNTAADQPAFHLAFDIPPADVVAHAIPALRLLAVQDWKEFFEELSLVEQILRQDPVGVYPAMTFATRNRYRKVIEDTARYSNQSEVELSRVVVRLATLALAQDGRPKPRFSSPAKDRPWRGLDLDPRAHVGYYLVDEGLETFTQQIGYHPPATERLRRTVFDHPTSFYLGGVTGLSLLVLAGMMAYAWTHSGSLLQTVIAGLFALIPAITIGVNIINWLVTFSLEPRVLPKLDFKEGIPAQCRTMVVVPAMLTSPAEVESLLSQLKLHYLRNPDPLLTFALLTDYTDAEQEHLPEDEALIEQAKQGLVALNQQYKHAPFYLFHRRRLWNESENAWLGWERKRGKLHEFNRLLRGDKTTSYEVTLGNLTVLSSIRYVITLDADTILPRDSAGQLVATLAHPLNQARVDPVSGRVTAGYTILQPRTQITATSANQSRFTRIFAGDTGLDLYTLAVSDVYQDLFGAGIYVGKGIYDVDAFEASLAGRVPENSLLSHDLFEGSHGRAGLVTDIILYEDYPPHYLVHIRRSHRWTRGDWQLLPWLWPRVPTARGQRVASPLALIDRWKIFDNLRRSLLPPALLFFFLAGWLWLPGSPWIWTLLGLLTPAWAFLISLLGGLIQLLTGGTWLELRRSVQENVLRWLLAVAFLPYEAALNLDAIFTTLVRLTTRREMLQWTTAAHTARLFGREVRLRVTRQQMISAILVSGTLAFFIFLINPNALPAAFPLLLAWLLSPEIAYWISRPLQRPRPPLSEDQRRQLRTLARRTWLFYEQFVGPQDNWLPPDHFQETPRGVVAHRTSPTNVGLFLLSVLSAYDFGYLDPLEAVLRLRSTFDTLHRLERYRGHFLNWIDTQSLLPLPPRYVSTVDSGNLAACFLTLNQGLADIADRPLWRWAQWQGLSDTLALLEEWITDGGPDQAERLAPALREQLALMSARIEAERTRPEQWTALLTQLLEQDLAQLDRLVLEWIESEGHTLDAGRLHTLHRGLERFHHHLESMDRYLKLLLPWLPALHRPPALFSQPEQLEPALASAWQTLTESLPAEATLTLSEITEACKQGREQLAAVVERLPADGEPVSEARAWCRALESDLLDAARRVQHLRTEIEALSQEAETFLQEMDFEFLYHPQRQVFHIGYNLDIGKLDGNYYDLLASEARIASLVVIAKNEIPLRHWLHLGRPVRYLAEGQTLLSWSGTMFEYLMPALLMRTYEGTLMAQSLDAAVEYQMAYGRRQGTPWGISESGYYAFDGSQNYQYRAFGGPGLGLKRGLGEDLVITPYASLLALPFVPAAVVENIQHLTRLKMMGRYGLYEAMDYTPARLALGQEYGIIASYMAHHQAMIMLSLTNYLHDEVMIERFHRDPRIQSIDLLLQERIPTSAPDEALTETEGTPQPAGPVAEPILPWEITSLAHLPQVHYLSNGRYGLLFTAAGSGYGRWQETMLTRWRADSTLDDWGSWFYIQDLDNGALWSAGYQPTAASPEHYRVIFHPHMIEIQRRDHDLAVSMQVTVAPEDDVEIRTITLTNDSDRPRRLRLATYGEVVLTSQGADERHPAFAKLFVQSEYLPDAKALLFRRRPRSASEASVFLAHTLTVDSEQTLDQTYESSRAHFLGRGRTTRTPAALLQDDGFSRSVGATLDPIFALSETVLLEPRSSVNVVALTLVAETRQTALELVERYRRRPVVERAFSQARTQSEREMRQLDFDTALFRHAHQLLGLLLYPHAARRADPAILAANQKGQSGLWGFAISGDYPQLLMLLESDDDLPLIRKLLRLHAYWTNRGLKIDLVILNQQPSGYDQALQGDLFRMIQRAGLDSRLNQRGGIFILRAAQMSEADAILLQSAARVILRGGPGSLADQLSGLYEAPARLPEQLPVLSPTTPLSMSPLRRPDKLQFDNGYGGFSRDGREYLIYLKPGQTTPAPWINVIANEAFGFLVSETGGGYTWALNSGENRLSVWRNDPTGDKPSEVLYLRDEETAKVWSPTPQPAPAAAPYLVRHGPGYSIFEHHSHGLRQQLRLFTAPEAPVKIVQLRLTNDLKRERRITATYYLEWVLGVDRQSSQQYLVTEYDQDSGALLARNPYNVEFGQRVAFVAANKALHSLTADRTEFLGWLGSLEQPAGLRRIGLEGRTHAGLDSCAALQLHLDLPPGGSETIYFLIGQGADQEEAQALIRQYQQPAQVSAAWQAVQSLWTSILETVQVDTPDPALNLLLNGWLLYQSLACRVWGRSALYQSSGAYGFRDQLQDVLAYLHSRPDLAREQILRAARHQFSEGDVLHWWHPPSGRGVRTRIRDDLLWLPYVTAHYVTVTGDESILQEQIPFLKGQPLPEDEDERYGQYDSSAETYPLIEHCRRALTQGDRRGWHGLPLMGSGDWNDGMNQVGSEGRGESVWLGWFLFRTLSDFANLCERLAQPEPAAEYRQQADSLRQALEANAWDGAWYRRAYYDDGTPLGSAQNRECQIDAIAQSWAVISGAADPARARQAMRSVLERLIRWDERLILLFTPPFDQTPRNPGYIKGYLPGVRENGGQYTHAALWTIWAMALLGEGEQAVDLYRLINPIYRTDTPAKVAQYQVEPYVISADVYSVPPHTGRGGWTWYTGSASWMYRLGLEAILGLKRAGDKLWLEPCLPKDWPGYRLTYRYGQSCYKIEVDNQAGINPGVKQVWLDGKVVPDGKISLRPDGRVYQVKVVLG